MQLRWMAEQGRAVPPLEPPAREVATVSSATARAERSSHVASPKARTVRKAQKAGKSAEQTLSRRPRRRIARDILLHAIPARRADAVTTQELAKQLGDTLVRVSSWLSFHWESAGLRRERRTGNKGIAYVYWRPAEVPNA